MMKKLVEVFRQHDSKMKGYLEAYNEVRRELEEGSKAGLITARVYNEKGDEARKVLDEAIAKVKRESLEQIDIIFAEVNEKVRSFVSTPPPIEFADTFAAIKALGENISKDEAEAFFEEYKDNYIATRSLSNYLHNLKGYLKLIPTYEKIKKAIDVNYSAARDFVINYKAMRYQTKLFTMEENNPWIAYGNELNEFTNGNVGIIAEESDLGDPDPAITGEIIAH